MFVHKAPCVSAMCLAVDVTRRLVIVSASNADCKLHVYSLDDGTLVRSFGSKGSGKGQFNYEAGGLCVTSCGTVLVAEVHNGRVQEVNVDDGSWVRFVGEGLLDEPNHVHCSDRVIAVVELGWPRVALFAWTDGALLTRFGSTGDGDGQLDDPYWLRLLNDGSGVVVADSGNSRLCVVSTEGAFVRCIPMDAEPMDMVECDGGASFIVANYVDAMQSKVSAIGGCAVPFGSRGAGDGQFNGPTALALVPGADGSAELVVLEATGRSGRFQVFRC